MFDLRKDKKRLEEAIKTVLDGEEIKEEWRKCGTLEQNDYFIGGWGCDRNEILYWMVKKKC